MADAEKRVWGIHTIMSFALICCFAEVFTFMSTPDLIMESLDNVVSGAEQAPGCLVFRSGADKFRAVIGGLVCIRSQRPLRISIPIQVWR